LGYPVLGGVAVRADMLERFAAEARTLARQSPFAPSRLLLSLLGLGGAATTAVLGGLGYQAAEGGFAPAPRAKKPRRRPPAVNADSPFAVLKRR